MNIIENEIPYLVEARTCGCNERGKSVSYRFVESSHSLCLDKLELISGQIQACERLLKVAKEEGEILLLKNEISKLKMALEIIQHK